MTRDEQIEALRAEVATLADFVKGVYRVAVEIRDDSRKFRAPFIPNPAETATTPKQAALPLDEDDGLPEPGGIARAIAAAPRRWGNSVKVYEWLWKRYEEDGFTTDCMAKDAANLPFDAALPVSVPTALRVLSALVSAGAAKRTEGKYWLKKPTDELRAAVEDARKGRSTA